MRFSRGEGWARVRGLPVRLFELRDVDVVLGRAGRLILRARVDGPKEGFAAECVLAPGGVSIGASTIVLRTERAAPPHGGPPVRGLEVRLWDEP